jgi:hypothetical protein
MLVLALSFSLMLYSAGLRTTFFSAESESIRNFGQNQARNIAQSAAAIAVEKILDEDDEDLNPESDETLQFPLSLSAFEPWVQMQGSYRYTIQNQADTLIIVRSTGRYENTSYTVEVTLEMGSDEWEFQPRRAVFAGTRINLEGSARIRGHVATNATGVGMVNMGWSTQIDSSLAIGPGGVPVLTVINPRPGNTNIGEGITTLTREETYPMPEFPDFPSAASVAASITVSGGGGVVTYSHTDFEGYYIPEIRIQGNRTIRMNVGNEDRVLYVGHLNIDQGHLEITGSGSLTIFVANNITLNGSSTLNRHGTPEQVFTFYKGASELSFAGSTTFKGGVFAETANIRIGGSGGIQGNIITGGSSVEIFGNAEANSRVIYAPNAHVQLTGAGRARGAIVSDRFSAIGAATVTFTSNLDAEIPPLKGGGGGGRKARVRNWR